MGDEDFTTTRSYQGNELTSSSKGKFAGQDSRFRKTPEQIEDEQARKEWATAHGGRSPGIADQAAFTKFKAGRKKRPAAAAPAGVPPPKPKPLSSAAAAEALENRKERPEED